MRRAVELHWPSLLVASACAGLAAANWVRVPATLAAALAVASLLVMARRDDLRLLVLALALALVGLGWGSLRLHALETSVLEPEIGAGGRAELVVIAPPRPSTWAVRALVEVRRFRDRTVRERALLVLPVGRSPPRGAVLEAVVRVREPRAAEDGGFDERAWLARQGVSVVLRAGAWREVGRRGGLGGVGDRLRERVTAAVDRGTDGLRRALVLGVVLGEDEGLPEHVREDFRASGLYHLLAVSGQNVAYIVGGAHALGWLLRLSRTIRQLAALAGIAAYVLAVGWQPSVVRAGVAGALASLAWLAARPADRWHFLAWGALVLLGWTPASLLEPGFQLSFAAVAAIFLAMPRARAVAEGYPVPRGVVEVLAVALVCGLATAPIVLLHFDRAPLYTVPANALAFLAMPWVLGLGLLATVLDPVSPQAATALAWLAGWAAAWLELVARLVSSFPGAEIGSAAAAAVAAGVAALVAGARAWRRRLGGESWVPVGAAGAALVLAVGWWLFQPGPSWTAPDGLRITFLDVGQGDAVLLETPGARVLVDQGPPEANVASQLAGMGIRSLSALVLTHPQRDHVGGAAAVLRQLDVGAVLDPALAVSGPERDEALAAARARRVPVREARAGSVLRAGGLVLRVLWPRDAGLPSEDPNTNAVVLLATYGDVDVFLPADAESDVTGRLHVGDVEVLKVAHHGSSDPGLPDELRELRPEVAVVSAGRGNPYGHPTVETLAVLAAVEGLEVYRTDEHGRVVVEPRGGLLHVRTEASR